MFRKRPRVTARDAATAALAPGSFENLLNHLSTSPSTLSTSPALWCGYCGHRSTSDGASVAVAYPSRPYRFAAKKTGFRLTPGPARVDRNTLTHPLSSFG